MKASFGSLVGAALLGVGILIVSTVVAFFASQDGVHINTDTWPAAAKAILNESPGEPTTSEQWSRIDKALAASPSNSRSSHLLAAEVRQAWYVFVVISILALPLAHRLWRPLAVGTTAAMLAPTLLLLLVAYLHVHPYYR